MRGLSRSTTAHLFVESPQAPSTRQGGLGGSTNRFGVTIVELLVVLAILAIVLAMALALFNPSLDDIRTREASRGTTAFFHGAKARAMETGRRFGVRIERYREASLEQQYAGQPEKYLFPQAAYRLTLIEQQPPYAGDFSTSRASVSYNTNTGMNEIRGLGIPGVSQDQLWLGNVKIGNVIKLGHKAHEYVIIPPTPFDATTGYITAPPTANSPWVIQSSTTNHPIYSPPEGLAYQIFRFPERVGTKEYELPKGIVIDLEGSGIDGDEFRPYDRTQDERYIDILFGPTGAVVELFYPNANDGQFQSYMHVRPTRPMYFLIGKIEQIVDVYTGESINDPNRLSNWEDLENLWVSINPSTGRVQSSPNRGYPSGVTNKLQQLYEARYYARTAQGAGGGQ